MGFAINHALRGASRSDRDAARKATRHASALFDNVPRMHDLDGDVAPTPEDRPDAGASGGGPAHVDVLSLRLGFGSRIVLDGLSCRFEEGKISVILGASGVGKSTLLRIIAGLQKPDYGDVWIGGKEITRMPSRELK